MKAIKWIAGAGLAAAFSIGMIFVPGVGASADGAAIDGGLFGGAPAQVLNMVRGGDGPAVGFASFDGNAPSFLGENGGRGSRGGAFGGKGGIMTVVTEQLGMSREELRAELEAGNSIADVAAAQGVALESIEDAILSQMSEKLAEKVANGDLTQEEADERLAQARERVSERLTQPFDGEGAGGRPGRHGKRGHFRGMIETVTQQLGMSGEELRAELEAGNSIADVAAAQGVALESIEDAILSQMSEKLAEKVANGDLTQEEADERLAQARERVNERLTQPFDGEGFGGRPGRHGKRGHFRGMIETVTQQLGISGEELRAELQAGNSIADVAAEQGVALESIEDAIISQMSEKLAEKVANGDLTQAEADERLAQARERVNERLTQPFDGEGFGGHHGRHGKRGHFRGMIETVTQQLGISGEELRAELQAGNSIADVAAAQGVALESIEDAIISQMSEKLAEKVANGDLTQEEADERLAQARERVNERLTEPGLPRGEGARRGSPRGKNGPGVSNFDSDDA